MSCIGLRYFNVFGRRQDPNGAYAAVIPKWINSFIKNMDIFINGDGTTSRDFCYIDNVIQINILAAISPNISSETQIFNVAFGQQISLNDLFFNLKKTLSSSFSHVNKIEPIYRDFRAGDVKHSLADIKKARKILDYNPLYDFEKGIVKTIDWYLKDLESK